MTWGIDPANGGAALAIASVVTFISYALIRPASHALHAVPETEQCSSTAWAGSVNAGS